MTVAMGADIHCAACGRMLQVESATRRNTACENTLTKTLRNQNKCMQERQFAAMSSLQVFNER